MLCREGVHTGGTQGTGCGLYAGVRDLRHGVAAHWDAGLGSISVVFSQNLFTLTL